jgi:environmental stress-induced protein Ves
MIRLKSDYKRSTWKNGLGFTDQIAIYPPGASLARGDFLWRLSSARIEKSSPFSMFPAHDRTLVILKGAGIRMAHTFEEGEPEDVTEVPRLQAYEFPGDIQSRCDLMDGPITDFSIFTRTGEVSAMVEVRELEPEEESTWNFEGKWNFVYSIENRVETDFGDLSEGDTLEVGPGEIRFHPPGNKVTLLLVSIHLP